MKKKVKKAKRKVSKKLLEWRSKQKHGSIMKPATFKKITRKARRGGYKKPKAVAGKAYWTTARAKAREAGVKVNEASWHDQMARTYSEGLELGRIDAVQGKNLVESRAKHYKFKAVFKQGYQHGRNTVKSQKPNPPHPIKIYDDILAIEAKKGSGSKWPGEKFRHDFKKAKGRAAVYGMPDGSVLIKGNKPLWKKFNYPK